MTIFNKTATDYAIDSGKVLDIFQKTINKLTDLNEQMTSEKARRHEIVKKEQEQISLMEKTIKQNSTVVDKISKLLE